MTIRDHKYNASFAVSRNLWPVAKIMLIYSFIVGLADEILGGSVLGVGSLLLEPAFIIGLSSAALTLQRGREPHHSQLWEGFKQYGKSLLLYYSCLIPSLLWGILFIVPGVMKWYSYSMAPFILAENPELSAEEARSMSEELTNEYKLRIFLLDLSYIGWGVVWLVGAILLKTDTIFGVLLSFVISLIIVLWIVPYVRTARADLYQYLKTQKDDEHLKNLGAKNAEEQAADAACEYFPITDDMRQDWQTRYQKKKKVTLMVCSSILAVAVLVFGWCIFRIKVQDKVPAILPDSVAKKVNVDVVREFTGYMWWNDDEYEPEQVTVKLNGCIKDGSYYGTVVVLGEKGVLYDFGEVQYIRSASTMPKIMFPDDSNNLNAIDYHLSYTYMDNRNSEIIIATGKNMWNTSYQYIGENYKTEQYSNKLHQINIYAPADSYESAIVRYNEALGLTEGQKMTIEYSEKD